MPVSGAFEKRLLAAMIRAVQAGGRIVRRHFATSRLEVREKSSPADLVSNVDLEVERRVIGILSRRFPGAAVVSEERENPEPPARRA
jgi:fructose-1,6-bisphosphatase/inositol monophosphatase family enzyme